MNAYNAAGPSGPDLPVSATTVGLLPAPTGLTATAVNAFQVNLSWTDNTNNELTFRIQRATNAAFTANVTPFSVGANITTFSDTTVAPATTYFYRVLAHGQLQDYPGRPRPR